MKISFDFDGTLEFQEVQQYAKELMKRGFDVCILTTRYSDVSKYAFEATNNDLFEVAHNLGITEIHFTEYQWKRHKIDEFGIDLHLDDNYSDEVIGINATCKARAVDYYYGSKDWKANMEDMIDQIQRGIAK